MKAAMDRAAEDYRRETERLAAQKAKTEEMVAEKVRRSRMKARKKEEAVQPPPPKVSMCLRFCGAFTTSVAFQVSVACIKTCKAILVALPTPPDLSSPDLLSCDQSSSGTPCICQLCPSCSGAQEFSQLCQFLCIILPFLQRAVAVADT